MKLTAPAITIASLALCSFKYASAVSTCTQSDATKILSLSGVILADPNCLEDTFSECPNADCLATLESVAKQMPNCLSNGTNPKVTFQTLVTECKAASVSGTTTTSDSSTSTTTTTTPTTTTTTKTPSSTSTSTTTTSTPSATIASILSGTSSPSTAKSAANGRSFSLSASIALSSAAAAAAAAVTAMMAF